MSDNNEPRYKATRRRVNPTIRWTECQTKELLEVTLAEIGNSPDAFEKPTAQKFYTKIAQRAPSVRSIDWHIIKNKMRNLKTSFFTTVSWKMQQGAVLLAEGKENVFREHIQRCCPNFDLLEKIYGFQIECNPAIAFAAAPSDTEDYLDELVTPQLLATELQLLPAPHPAGEDFHAQFPVKVEVTEPCIELDTSGSKQQDDSTRTMEASNNDSSAVADYCHLGYTPEPSTASNSETDFTATKNSPNRHVFQRAYPTSSSEPNSVSLLVNMQEKKLKFEIMKLQQQLDLDRQKLALEREKLSLSKEQSSVDVELRKLELDQQMQLKRLEMERDERLALARMKLEVESQERIRRYELELNARASHM